MTQSDTAKQEKKRRKFKVFVCYNTEDNDKALVLESILSEKGLRATFVNNELYGKFISTDLKEMIRSSVCFVAIFTSNFINSSLANQEIGYAQGKGLKVILLVDAILKNEIQDVDKKLTVIEFNKDDFREQFFSVADKVAKIAEILEEPIDFESFLEFYSKSKSETQS